MIRQKTIAQTTIILSLVTALLLLNLVGAVWAGEAKSEDRFYVITGGPGTGKTSVINSLIKEGYQFKEEAARAIIEREQKKTDGTAILPWTNIEAFNYLIKDKEIQDYNQLQQQNLSKEKKIIFFDRGLPDLLAYLKVFNAFDGKIPDEFYDACKNYRYNTKVFIAPPWKKIYENDSARKESYEEAMNIHNHLVDTYKNLGYEIIVLPLASIQDRVQFIIEHLN